VAVIKVEVNKLRDGKVKARMWTNGKVSRVDNKVVRASNAASKRATEKPTANLF
jgi:hypothetical protein